MIEQSGHVNDDGKPGDRYAMDADLTLYWPWVRACWEERREQ